MKKITSSLFFIFACNAIIQSQIVEQWSVYDTSATGYDYCRLAIIDEYLYSKALVFGGQYEQAMRVKTDGTEASYMSHYNMLEPSCVNCIWLENNDIDWDAEGNAYTVGQQPASPYAAGYLSKLNANGELQYTNEYWSSFSKEFSQIELSQDENFLLVYGNEFDFTAGMIMPTLTKFEVDGNFVDSLVLPGDVYIEDMISHSNSNLYAVGQFEGGSRLSVYDENLNWQWEHTWNVGGSGVYNHRILEASNGDIVIFGFMQVNGGENKVFLSGISATGVEQWETTYTLNTDLMYSYQYGDFTIDSNDHLTLVMTSSYAEVVDQIVRGKGGDQYYDAEVYRFDWSGNLLWHSTYSGPENDPIIDQIGMNGFADENGNVILSAYQEDNNKGQIFALYNASGALMDEFIVEDFEYEIPKGLIYGGNQTFYANMQGDVIPFDNYNYWINKKFHYDLPENVEDVRQEDVGLTIFPNPACDRLNVSFANYSKTSIHVFDAGGNLVVSETTNGRRASIDISSLASGTYEVVVQNAFVKSVKQLIVAKK